MYVYYQLENFYQNHRRYVKSRSSDQLQGTAGISSNALKSDCDPLYQNGSLILSPCGLIANSLFNGELVLYFLLLLFGFQLAMHTITRLTCFPFHLLLALARSLTLSLTGLTVLFTMHRIIQMSLCWPPTPLPAVLPMSLWTRVASRGNQTEMSNSRMWMGSPCVKLMPRCSLPGAQMLRAPALLSL